MQPAIRNRYNYDRRENSENNALYIDSSKEEENLTKQEFAEEVDINTILRRFNITGQLPENVRMPTYADFSEVYDFHSAANAIAQAKEAFEQMPADVRYRFGNDPAAFLAFCDNPANAEEAAKLGLTDPRPPEARSEASTSPPAPSTASTEGTPPPAAPAGKGDTGGVT